MINSRRANGAAAISQPDELQAFKYADSIGVCVVIICCHLLQQPILVDQGMLRAMERALWSDTSFLAGLGVMDYSLLVGEYTSQTCLVY